MHVPHRFLDRYEEHEMWFSFAFTAHRHYPGQPARGVSTFTALCSLSVIMVSLRATEAWNHIHGMDIGPDYHPNLR
jgi:hypothetical protein